MKKLFTSLLLLLSFVSFSQNQNPVGHLTVFSESGAPFFMYLNGELQNDVAQTNIRIEDLNQQFYNVKIKFQDKTLNDISKNNVTVIGMDGVYIDVTYKIKIKKNKARMNFFSSVPVVQNYQAPAGVYVVHGNPNIQNPPAPVINNGVSLGGINVNINSPNSNQGQGRDNYPQRPRNDEQRGCVGAYEMSPNDYENAKIAINKERFNDQKIKTMFQIIQSNCLSTNQIAAFMKIYTFDDDRLKIAKFSLDFCVDPKNFYQLNELLTFDNAKNDLIDYAKSKRF